jgi:hypothetical protein
MAKPHKDKDLAMEASTTLDDAAVAQLAKKAMESTASTWDMGGGIRLEEARPGLLSFSIRGPGGLVEQLTFNLRADADDGVTRLRTTITRYKTLQQRYMGIPLGPRKMVGLPTYRKFIRNFIAELQRADPSATATADVRTRAV